MSRLCITINLYRYNSMSYSIFLDDERIPTDVTWLKLPDTLWYVARTYQAFIDGIKLQGMPEYITFDHDLQDFNEDGTENTGYTCLKWLVDYCIDHDMMLPVCFFHSMNPIGVKNMKSYYENALRFQ